MSRQEMKLEAARIDALKKRISAGGSLSASSLAQSYALPQVTVERILKENGYA